MILKNQININKGFKNQKIKNEINHYFQMIIFLNQELIHCKFQQLMEMILQVQNIYNHKIIYMNLRNMIKKMMIFIFLNKMKRNYNN